MGNPNWVAGKSANPAGRPKFSTMLTDCLVARLLHPADDKSKAKTKMQLFVNRLVADGIAGIPHAVSEIYNRIEGKAVQPVDIEHKISIVQLVLEASKQREQAIAIAEQMTPVIDHAVTDAIAEPEPASTVT